MIFGINDININCGVDLFYFKDKNGLTGIVRDVSFAAPAISIAAHSTNNFPCTAASYLYIRSDNSLQIGFAEGQNLATAPSAFRAPLTVIKMCLLISGDYIRFGRRETFSSNMFQWPAAPGQQQWIEGQINPDLPNDAWIPEGSKIGAVWALRSMMELPWKDKYRAGALQCSQTLPAAAISYQPSTQP